MPTSWPARREQVTLNTGNQLDDIERVKAVFFPRQRFAAEQSLGACVAIRLGESDYEVTWIEVLKHLTGQFAR